MGLSVVPRERQLLHEGCAVDTALHAGPFPIRVVEQIRVFRTAAKLPAHSLVGCAGLVKLVVVVATMRIVPGQHFDEPHVVGKSLRIKGHGQHHVRIQYVALGGRPAVCQHGPALLAARAVVMFSSATNVCGRALSGCMAVSISSSRMG